MDTGIRPLLSGMISISSFFLTLYGYVIRLLSLVAFFTSKKVTKEGGSYSQALPPLDGGVREKRRSSFLSAPLRASPEKALRNSLPKNAPLAVLA
ncbi:MAG: hypothetical protein ACJA0C_000505 [Candidatus Endobugula sp.]|jgi:hypothetical protein